MSPFYSHALEQRGHHLSLQVFTDTQSSEASQKLAQIDHTREFPGMLFSIGSFKSSGPGPHFGACPRFCFLSATPQNPQYLVDAQ